MPRPGPRPYECVRRAWHSDRHQPMRGSLIQEIFRIVNEIHSPGTKKNKEWQEKLPVVVLKAEEIIYSKANSEAEYMDLKTLWERTNDAINTIIRRDESTETGDLLQPCIEAALNLGCTPRRASRSQRHNNPRCYLSFSTRATSETSGTLKVADNRTHEGPSNLQLPRSQNSVPNSSPLLTSYCSTLITPAAVSSAGRHFESARSVFQNRPPHEQTNLLPVTCRTFPVFSDNFHPTCQNKFSTPMETYPSPTSGKTFPLYYCTDHRPFESQFMFQNTQDSNCNAFTAGAPCVRPNIEGKTSFLQNFLGCDNFRYASTGTQQPSNFVGTSENTPDKGYDLSLRLGLLPTPSLSTDISWSLEVEETGASISRDGSRCSDISPSTMRTAHFGCSTSSSQREKGFSFFPVDTGDGPLEFGSSKWNSEGEGLNVEDSAQKRKMPVSHAIDDRQFCWQPRPSTSQFFGRRKGPSS